MPLDHPVTSAGAIKAAGLDWEVTLGRVQESLGKPIPGYQVVTRADRNEHLGIAGSTMISALRAVRAGKPQRVIAAVGAAPREALDRVRDMVDELYALATPLRMESVASCYRDFSMETDDKVIALLRPTASRAR